MTALDRVLPTPRLLEVDEVDLALPPARAWEVVRHFDFAGSPIVRALFVLRTLPSRLREGAHAPLSLKLDDITRATDKPGFRVLVDDAPREFVVGAIGRVWEPDIPFVDVSDAREFHRFGEPGFVKVAWAIRLSPLGEHDTRLTFELRVDATDEESWRNFRRYFRLIGPASRFIRRSMLASFAREYGTPEAREAERPLLGDELLPDAAVQFTHGITIAATPSQIWPWLVQMGCHRAGFYAIDVLDNAGVRSAREIHPELQELRVGEIIDATPGGDGGFEVLRIERDRLLVLGGLHDVEGDAQLPFASPRPERYSQMTWAFVLEPLDEQHTRLHVRARGAFSSSERLHALWIRPVHALMQTTQLRNLARRAEGRQPDDLRDVVEGVSGAAIMTAAFLTPFLRYARNRWGLDAETAARPYPGDELIATPRWMWTHAIEIDAPADEVWPWVAQIGADRGGFYSYQWLENVAGCNLRNAETIHPEWEAREGGTLSVHPDMPRLNIVAVHPGRFFVVHGAPGERAPGERFIEATWLFFVEPLGEHRCRVISRYRCACSDDLATRLQYGEALVEPIGFAMDRRMLMGLKERAERAALQKRPMRSSSTSSVY